MQAQSRKRSRRASFRRRGRPVCRGVRGATTVEGTSRELILTATAELLERMVQANGIETEDIASAIFTTSPDLTAEYPALAARLMGWRDVALLCGHEMAVPGGLERCVRILLHWNTTVPASDVEHVYIHGASNLRPDREELDQLRRQLERKTR
ncbi:MAG: chorismate mutase [Holophagales bacterium]|nr:chorismate mutase [Holophagales bacterium]MYC08523.1 chorismate mutase [Holophagales bacterium]